MTTSAPAGPPPPPPPSGAYLRFVASVTGPDPAFREAVDEATLKTLDKRELRAAQELLMARLDRDDWRAPPALAATACRGAVMPMKRRLAKASPKMRVVIARALVDLEALPDADATIAEVLRAGDPEGGIAALSAAAGRRSVAVRNALAWSAKHHPDDDVRMNAGAQLYVLAGLTDDPLAWAFRPTWIRLGADDPAERTRAYDEIASDVGLPADAAD
jgi:hypothetical protein